MTRNTGEINGKKKSKYGCLIGHGDFKRMLFIFDKIIAASIESFGVELGSFLIFSSFSFRMVKFSAL
jgi:hypothetical protein